MTTTNPIPDVPLPTGATVADSWESDPGHRVIMGATRGVTDYDVVVWTSAVQYTDGALDDGGDSEPPSVHVNFGDSRGMNSDQARELAAALLEAAAEIDGWEQR
jgi:hypothetical protein